MSQSVATSPLPAASQLEWVTRLVRLMAPAQIASAIVASARDAFGGDGVRLAWSGDTILASRDETAATPDDADLRRATALLSGTQTHTLDGDRLALRLPQARAVLLAC